MQDGTVIPAEEAGEWLREHFQDDPAPTVDIAMTWNVTDEPDDGSAQRLMEILFGPRPERPAA